MAGWRTYPTQSNKVITPFAITQGSLTENPTVNADDPSSDDNQHYIDDGVIFTSFSFATGTFLHIDGIKKSFPFDKGYKFYIEMDVLPNLQVEKAQIKCGEVGKKDSWASYPALYEIEPKDEVDENGMVTKIVNGKTQTKCYVLIGYREDDPIKDPSAEHSPDLKNAPDSPVQILNHNIILLASVLSGVPLIFPMPYFDGSTHLQMVRFEE